MPRKRQVVQPAKAPGGLEYGEQTRLRDAQAHMPLPGSGMPPGGSTQMPPGAPAPGGAVPAPGPGGAPTGGVAPAPPPNALQAAAAFDGQHASAQLTPLDAPTSRPMEPITSGMPTGLGPGPSQFRPNSAANALQLIAEKTGDPAMANLANLAQQQGF